MNRAPLKFSPLCLVLLLCGCSSEEPIVRYTVERDRETVGTSTTVPEGKAWFVKLSGPVTQVVPQLESFIRLVADVEFPQGEPEFDLPAGWKEQPGDNFRHSTILIGGTEPPLGVSVSSLGYEASQRDAYTLANVNRWRGQLALPTWEASNWRAEGRASQELLSFDTDNHHLEIVRLIGETAEHGKTLTLAAIYLPITAAERSAEPPPAMADVPVRTAPAPFKYELPPGWEETAGNSVRIASFKVSSDAGVLDISVTRFPGGGDLLPNINRWRGQVKLAPITAAEVDSAMPPVEISGIDSRQGEFNGPEEGILVAAVPDGDSQWFFKAQGPVAAIAAERAKFQAFLQSIQFE